MSKSVGNVIDPFALADAYGVDQLRYFFLREVPFGQDGNYSHEAIVNRINADLANDLGNLAQRSLTMIARQLGGVLPQPGAFTDDDKAILAAADAMIGKAREAMKTQQLHQVLNAVWAVVADANRYFAGEAPWALAKTDPARQGTVLYVTAEVIRQVAILAQPFMPASAGKLLDLLGVPAGRAAVRRARRRHSASRAGTTLPAPSAGVPALCRARGAARPHNVHARRQPLPSRFSRLRGRARRRRGARPRRRHRAHGHDLDAGARHARAAGHRRALSRRLLLGRHPSASRPRGARHHAPPISSRARAIPRWWRSARPGSTITTTTARATRRSRASAPTSRPRARPACRWSSIRATPTPTWRASCEEETGKGAFPAVLHCFTGGPRARRARDRARALRSRSPAS